MLTKVRVTESAILTSIEEEIFGEEDAPLKIRSIALTDSVHNYNKHWSKRVRKFVKENATNWACSEEELDTKLKAKGGCRVVSAGTESHELASASCIDSVFEYFDQYE